MAIPTLEEIKQRFPIGDYIEYQTGNGFFSGLIVGYETCKYGISLNLGDRKFPIWSDEDFKQAEKYYKSTRTKIIKAPKLEQLTLF
jgi:hypothetical protein